MFSAGRVLLMPKGAYNPLTTYEMLDIVSYNGSSYIAKGTTTGNLPTDTTYWQLSAYGGQAANIAGNFAELESSSVATATHYVDDIFVDENSQLMKATQTINIGDTIDANVNCAPTTVEALIAYLSSYVDSLDSLNKKIQGAIEIAAQTDLHSLAIGEYYKKQSTFYVTNGPTGIDQDPTAIFRLTVEAALDNASQASSPLLLTLRTPDGKIYTQSFDGTNWGSWVEVASAASVSALNTAKQPKTLDTPITVGGVQQTTVEGALGSINQTLSNEVKTRERFNVDNLIETTLSGSWTHNDTSFSVNPDKSITATIISTLSADENYPIVNMWSGFDISDHIGDRLIITGCNDSFRLLFVILDSSSQEIYNFMCPDNGSSFIVPSGSVKCRAIMSIKAGTTAGTSYTYYPRLSVAMTNQELTPIAQAVSNRNLLDNPWFTINQRGQASYTGNVYGPDRWLFHSGQTVTVSNNGISVDTDDDFWQRFGTNSDFFTSLIGKTVTISVLTSTGVIYSGSAIVNSTGLTQCITGDKIIAFVGRDQYFDYIGIRAMDTSITIRAIKLELGSVSTLAQDTAPNYAEELLKCQRFFKAIPMNEMTARINSAGTNIRFPISLIQDMRSGAKTATTNVNALYVVANGQQITLTMSDDVSSIGCDSNANTSKSIYVSLSSAGQTKVENLKNMVVGVWIYGTSGSSDPYIFVSADL